jgi:HEAT repeat protein
MGTATMLESLEEIDWGNLHHAYGPASDVPDLLRALASPRRKERSRAIYDLYGNIWHQGTVYEATAYAVPFLIELLREPAVQDKAAILGLLQAVARGTSYLEVHQDLEWYRQERKTAPFQEQLREEVAWVRKAGEAVSAGAPVYKELLAAPSLKLRIWSAYVLSTCTGRCQEVASALRGRLRRERHPLARASLVWAWISLCRDARRQGLAGPPSDTGVRKALRALVRSRREKAAVRLLAGLGLMQFLPERDYPGIARFLAAALARCPRGLARLPWVEGEPMYFIYLVLAHQRGLVLGLFSSIVETPEHPFREDTVCNLEEIILAQPRARSVLALLLGKLLDSANGKVRQNAARLLGQMGRSGQLAREELAKALGDSDPEVGRHAAVALSKMGDTRAVPFLKECLARGDTHRQVMEAIKRLGPAAADTLPLLRQVLLQETGNTRVLAAHALALLGEEGQGAVLEVADVLSDPSTGAGAGWALMQWGPLACEAVPRIVDFLQDQGAESPAGLNAVKALGSMGLHARPALGVLERLLLNPSREIRVAAATALWNDTPRAAHAVPVLVEVLQETRGNPRASHACVSALAALEVIGPAGRSAASLARELLDDPDQWTRVRAARALWRMGEPLEVFLPVLIEELRCRPVGLLAAECLAEVGPPAAAVPRLQAILAAEGSVSEGGLADEMVEREEEFLQAVSAALRSIQGAG